MRADGGGLVYGAAVVLERGAAARFVSRRKQPGAAVARHRKARGPDHIAGPFGADSMDDVAPGGDRRDTGADATLDELLQGPRFYRRRIDGEQGTVLRQVTHQCTPRAAITVVMRFAASSGSASRPTASASRNSSARCSVERVLSWPPIMVKWLCRP